MSLGAESSPSTIRVTTRNSTAPTVCCAFGRAERHDQLLMRVVQATTLAQAAVERFDVTTHKPLSQGTFSKATAAWGSLHSANSNETPIQSLLELSQQLFREIHLEVPRPAFTHAMRCVPQEAPTQLMYNDPTRTEV